MPTSSIDRLGAEPGVDADADVDVDAESAGSGAGEPPAWFDRVDPRARLLATVGYVVLVVSTPMGWPRLMVVEAMGVAFHAGLAGAEPGRLFRRWLAFAPLVGFLAAMVAIGHPARAELGYAGVVGSILAKNSLAFLALMVLTSTMPMPEILGAMARLGVPKVLVATLRFMDRQGQILADESRRMMRARRSRTFRRSGRVDFGRLTGLIAMLFLRSFERGERVHSAMLARGWDGTVRTLDGRDGPA